MVAIDRNRVLRTNSPVPDRGGNKTRRNVINASKINTKVMIIEVAIINRRLCCSASCRLIIIADYPLLRIHLPFPFLIDADTVEQAAV